MIEKQQISGECPREFPDNEAARKLLCEKGH